MRATGPRRNIRLLLEYDGAAYHGWQMQAEVPSIQGVLSQAISQLLNEPVTLTVAGRTDAGVHARCQVVNFFTHTLLPASRLPPGINYYLPRDVSVHEAIEVPLSFSAKINSLSKKYRYRIYSGPQDAALEQRSWQIRQQLNIEQMQKGAAQLIGEHDFNAFRSIHCDAKHAVREIYAIDIIKYQHPPVGERVEITIHGNAFCRHMCRIIAGTLVDIGRGRAPLDGVKKALTTCVRKDAGVTAPACGLTLIELNYPPLSATFLPVS